KPSNVLLHKDGRIVLSDFGIVKTLDAVTNVSLTGAVLGTPEYMAPEQFDDSPQIDARTDIYALGVMLYRVFAGRTPFQGSIISVANKHLHELPPAVASPGHPVPAEVEAVILKALSKKPDGRYASAGELSAALGQALLPTIMLEQARASVRRGDLERAEQIANQLLADNPANTAAGQLRAEVDLARRGEAIVGQVNQLLQAGDWRGALIELERSQLKESQDPRVVQVVQWAESMRAAEQARIEAELERFEAERLQREREEWERAERERQERETRERTERERLAREAMDQAERERQA